MLLAGVWPVVVAVPLGWIRFFSAMFSIFSPQRSFFLYYLTCDMCLRCQGCPVVLDIELPVSARHQKTRSLLCARRLVLLLAAAASGGVRHKFSKLHSMRVKQSNEFGPIRAPENNDFWRPAPAKLSHWPLSSEESRVRKAARIMWKTY